MDPYHEAFFVGDPNDRETLLTFANWLEGGGDLASARIYRLAAANYITDGAIEAVYQLPATTLMRANLLRKGLPYNGLAYAKQVAAWLEANWKIIKREATILRMEPVWLERAKLGDVGALLAHPVARVVIEKLAENRRTTNGPGASYFTSKRKAIKIAKELLAVRLLRRYHRGVSEAARNKEGGRFRKMFLAKRKKRAMAMAWAYHKNVKSLFQSKRATIVYGVGGTKDKKWPYSGSYKGYPATWQNAGARLDDEEKPTCVIVENFRGTTVARLPFKKHS